MTLNKSLLVNAIATHDSLFVITFIFFLDQQMIQSLDLAVVQSLAVQLHCYQRMH